jgi:abnormal spindle-like microcephaly-associated protein
MQLGNRTQAALAILLTSKHLTQIHRACSNLEVSTRLSYVCCESLIGNDAVPIIFTLIRSCNRSKPHVEVLKMALNILRNLARWKRTVGLVLAAPGAVDIIIELLQMYRDKPDISLRSISLLRLLAATPANAAILAAVPDAVSRLSSIHAILARKAKMEKRLASKRRNAGASRVPPVVQSADQLGALLTKLEAM